MAFYFGLWVDYHVLSVASVLFDYLCKICYFQPLPFFLKLYGQHTPHSTYFLFSHFTFCSFVSFILYLFFLAFLFYPYLFRSFLIRFFSHVLQSSHTYCLPSYFRHTLFILIFLSFLLCYSFSRSLVFVLFIFSGYHYYTSFFCVSFSSPF